MSWSSHPDGCVCKRRPLKPLAPEGWRLGAYHDTGLWLVFHGASGIGLVGPDAAELCETARRIPMVE